MAAMLEDSGLVHVHERRWVASGSEDMGDKEGMAALALIAHVVQLGPSGGMHN